MLEREADTMTESTDWRQHGMQDKNKGEESRPNTGWGFVERHIYLLGLMAPIVTLGCAFITATAFEGRGNRTYSPFVHWVSNLGNQNASPWAEIFNAGMIIGAIMLCTFIVVTCLMLRSKVGYVVAASGIVATVGMGFIGVFSEGAATRVPHVIAGAAGYIGIFGLGASFSIFILTVKQDLLPKWLFFPSLLAAVCSGVFILLVTANRLNLVSSGSLQWVGDNGRPIVKLIPMFEWLGLLSVFLWCFLAAWTLRARSK